MVSFTTSQCITVAEAVERGLRRREAAGKEISTMGPVCTIMVGRLDDSPPHLEITCIEANS
jgi:transaldolase